jgi:hypothetical protein
MRLLVHIPIVHDEADLGSAHAGVRQAYIEEKGEAAWKHSREALAKFWRAVEHAMDHLGGAYTTLRLYQDGLPVCGFERKIVDDLARQGGANYRILAKLADRGARIEGTEDPDLLRQEYELIMAGSVKPGGIKPAEETAAVLADLLDRRDRFIAERIDRTLLPGETGLLFLGALHHAAERLPKTIQVCALAEFLRTNGRR